jgi:hypothetical protein
MAKLLITALVPQVALIAAQGSLTGIRVKGVTDPVWEKTLKPSPSGQQSLSLDLMERSDQITIELLPKTSSPKYRVEWRFETSLRISNEGPHLDLDNWRHHVSPWIEINPKNGSAYSFRCPNKSKPLPFPKVSMAEVRAEVAKSSPEWSPLISGTKSIREYPIGVGLSKVSIRISEFQSEKWIVIQTIHLQLPMGC